MTTAKTGGRFAAILACLLLTDVVANVTAHAKEWLVQGNLAGKKGGPSQDMSGIACATDTGFPRTCLVIDDELQAAQVVTLTDSAIIPGELIPLISDMHDGKPVELDGEGVAFDKGFFYVIGSHGRPRDETKPKNPAKEKTRIAARLTASSKIIRIKFDAVTGKVSTDPAVPPSTALAKLIDAHPSLAPFKDRTLEDGGITIEGVAVLDGRLYAGFRGPLVKKGGKDEAVMLSVALGHLFDGAPAAAELHSLDLKGRGVRDLTVYDGGILVLAGPVQSVDGSYSVYRWNGKLLNDKPSADLPFNGSSGKPEGLLPLGREGGDLRVLVLLDSATNGKPQSVLIPY